ncbi:flagellar basal body P-ring formation protein FlgA [Rhodoblastus acidophilus]|uniref:Flagella basal body P-ring formation protein FlgA n=1 Tax=Rhodoblastus acidophilus TaxID=1074 RepID=A0A6N8DQJ0_RHOAC|nr:flagellar basal body P-ring formation chaperone FlgA [Rhodoblastus acidophilus]MCW2274963.1 flagella basal body P-ring formation protein FlgA [Rhodoblastus acidophilus]MTV31453.1 flagellar basal body P-ring formation protein FlgA [Rhodoblastus acidophilus]
MGFLARLLALAATLAASSVACAGSREIVAPTQVIYPGDRITDAMLGEVSEPNADLGGYLVARGQLVGKVARRTLLPGKAIPAIAVEEPRAVSMGGLVQLVYEKDGLSIATTAQALQNGYVGQIVQVRNIESGIVVFGAIQADGSVLVNGG